jgi:hypothetical protein
VGRSELREEPVHQADSPPTDFSHAPVALTLAIQFAGLLRAANDPPHVQPIPAYIPVTTIPGATPVPPPTPEATQGIHESLDVLAAAVREPGVECDFG